MYDPLYNNFVMHATGHAQIKSFVKGCQGLKF